MAQGPYTVLQQAPNLPMLSHSPSGTIQVMAADTPNVSAQKEVLYVRTQVAPPDPDHPQGAELAVLLRVQSLIAQQFARCYPLDLAYRPTCTPFFLSTSRLRRIGQFRECLGNIGYRCRGHCWP